MRATIPRSEEASLTIMRNSQKFWRATRQSNLADRMEDSFIGRNTVLQFCEYENQTLQAFVPGTICLQSLIVQVARQNYSLLVTAHDCETA